MKQFRFQYGKTHTTQHNNQHFIHSKHITQGKKSSQSNIKKFCCFFLDISLSLYPWHFVASSSFFLAFIKFNLIVAIIGLVYRIRLHLICFGWARFLVIPFAFDCIKTWTHRHKIVMLVCVFFLFLRWFNRNIYKPQYFYI